MKKLLNTAATGLVMAASLAFAGPAIAQDAAAAEPQAETAPQKATPALWRVSDDDTTIYLFGTVHVLPEGIDWESGVIGDAMGASDELVTELGEIDEAALGATMGQRGVFTDGTTLRSLLDDDQRARYEAVVAGLGAPVEAFDQVEPWMAAVTLSMLPLMKEGWNPEEGGEAKIDAIFDAREIDAEGLETVEEQIDFFDTLPQDVQVDYLMSIIDDFDEVGTMMTDILGEWREGDVDSIAALIKQSFGDPVLYKRLLTDRNERWSVWIDDRMDEPGTVFIAVGAGHLAGQDSVQDFLQKRGISVTRVQ